MNLVIFWLAAWFLCAYTLFEIFPEARLSLGAKILRWCRQWRINNIGKIIDYEELEKDRRDFWDMGQDLEDFDETADLEMPYLIQEFGKEYAHQKMGPVSVIEEMY